MKYLIVATIISTAILLFIIIDKYREFESFDGNYKIVIYRMPVPFSAVGGSGDSSGFVCLFNKRGLLLNIKKVEMVQSIDTVIWKPNSVDIKLFAEWELK